MAEKKASADTAESSGRTPKVGDILVVTVEPGSNHGRDEAPALVTSVDKAGLVHALVFREHAAPPQLLGGLVVFPNRAAVDELDEHDDPDVRATRPAYAAYYA